MSSVNNAFSRGFNPFNSPGQMRTNDSEFEAHTNLLSTLHQAEHAAYNSPWRTIQPGYARSSPTDTASSGSSNHSLSYYSKSPESHSVDSLVHDLLNHLNFPSLHNVQNDKLLMLAEERNNKDESYRLTCRDCTVDVFCENCLKMRNAQNFIEGTLLRDTTVERILAEDLSPSTSRSSSAPSPQFNQSTMVCEIHRDSQKIYCQTCGRVFCIECSASSHQNHVTTHLMDAVEVAGRAANQIMHEAKEGIAVLKEDIESVRFAAETLDQKAKQATADLLLCMRRVVGALEQREKELLTKIEKTRLLKNAALKAREEGLRNGMARLSGAIEKLSETMEMSAYTCNPTEVRLARDVTYAELFQLHQLRSSLPLIEENWISFNGAEANVVHAISHMGNVITNNPGSIGDRRAVRGRGASPSFAPPFNPNVAHQAPRGRPIPSANFPVVVKTGRTGPPQTALTVIGDHGDVEENLCRPWGVACDSEGRIIIADRSNNRIQIFNPDGSCGRKFGCHGTQPGQFDRPAGVAVDCKKRIIVADKDNHRIQVLTMEGLFILSFGEKGSRCGQFNYPWDVAVNSECQIVVSDTRNHRVQLFSSEGVFLRKYGYETTPSMWKHFDSPRGVAFSPEGHVVTTDFNNHRVLIIDSDFLSARVLGNEGSNGAKQFLRPQGLIVDDEGNIIVSDSRNHRIQVFDFNGNLKWKFGTYGKGLNEMDRPSGIALTPDGRIVLVDFGNNRVLLV